MHLHGSLGMLVMGWAFVLLVAGMTGAYEARTDDGRARTTNWRVALVLLCAGGVLFIKSCSMGGHVH